MFLLTLDGDYRLGVPVGSALDVDALAGGDLHVGVRGDSDLRDGPHFDAGTGAGSSSVVARRARVLTLVVDFDLGEPVQKITCHLLLYKLCRTSK